jgi:hypothetical protein
MTIAAANIVLCVWIVLALNTIFYCRGHQIAVFLADIAIGLKHD